MSGDPQPAMTAVPAASDLILTSVSVAAFAATTVDVPRPVAMTLDVARHHAFTGEITFALDPVARVYLDGGVVYHAERDGELTVSEALLDGKVIDARQLERGMVRVGDVEHLGRLFERDSTIDRDSVMVVVEHHTDFIVSDLARSAVATVTINPYRHHPSGLHRWFVAPVDASGHSARPVSEVAQVDRSVVDEIPDLARPNEAIRIEWNEPDPAGLGLPLAVHLAAVNPSDADLQAELDRFDADHADWAMAPSSVFGAPTEIALTSPLGDFHIVWPDGTADDALVVVEPAIETPVVEARPEEPTVESTAFGEPPTLAFGEPDVNHPVALTPGPVADNEAGAGSNESLAWPLVVSGTPPVAPAPHESSRSASDDSRSDVSLEALVPPRHPVASEPLFVEQIPAPDAAVPDDVAAAVRRALQAIDEASLRRDANPRSRLTSALPRLTLPDFNTSFAPVGSPVVEPVVVPVAAELPPPQLAPAPPVGFAPPTLDMRVEAIYERESADAETPTDESDFAMVPEASLRAAGKASVVFLDDEPTDAADPTERRSALRRLIRSLRSSND